MKEHAPVTQPTKGAALMRVVKAAIAVRKRDMTRANGLSVYAYNELINAVDALALVGAAAELEETNNAAT